MNSYRPPKSSRILAIDPGTLHLGFAVMDQERLIRAGVETVRPRRSPHETLESGRGLIHRLIRDYRPGVLAVEKTFFANNRNSSLLNVFCDEIRLIGKKKKLRVLGFAPGTVKKAVTGDGRAKKEQVARVIVARYPELKVYLTADRKWKVRYHQNMFDAIAVALTAESRLASP